jgi:hypothetical protein
MRDEGDIEEAGGDAACSTWMTKEEPPTDVLSV